MVTRLGINWLGVPTYPVYAYLLYDVQHYAQNIIKNTSIIAHYGTLSRLQNIPEVQDGGRRQF